MGELQQLYYLPPPPLPPPTAPPTSPPPPPPASSHDERPPSASHQAHPPPPRFDPSRMVGIIRRKALIKDLAAVYHAECLTYCQELLELQSKLEEEERKERKISEALIGTPFNCVKNKRSLRDKSSRTDLKIPENSKKETIRPPKRLKKSR